MKTKAIVALMVAGALGFTACTKKIDEKTMGEITQFGTDWTALGEKGMVNEYSTFKATWDETTKQFTEWKDKIAKGEISGDEASKGLADFRTKMSDAQTKIDTWNSVYAEVKSSCEKNMAAADEMAKSMETTSAKK